VGGQIEEQSEGPRIWHVREDKKCTLSLVGKGEVEDGHLNWQTIFKWIVQKQDKQAWLGIFWFRIGSVMGCLEHSSGSIKRGELLDWLMRFNFSRTLLYGFCLFVCSFVRSFVRSFADCVVCWLVSQF
jgi:hypothetical protein